MFQKNPERRRSGMNRRNLGSMYGGTLGIPAIWMAHRVHAVRARPRATRVQIRSRRICQAVHAEIGIAEESS